MPLTLRPPRPCFVVEVMGSGMRALHRTTALEPTPPMAALTRRVA